MVRRLSSRGRITGRCAVSRRPRGRPTCRTRPGQWPSTRWSENCPYDSSRAMNEPSAGPGGAARNSQGRDILSAGLYFYYDLYQLSEHRGGSHGVLSWEAPVTLPECYGITGYQIAMPRGGGASHRVDVIRGPSLLSEHIAEFSKPMNGYQSSSSLWETQVPNQRANG